MRERMTKAERHEQLLQSAWRLFRERGYESVTIADVIAASNVARGTFYLHFQSLDDVLAALFDRVAQATWQRIAPLIQDETLPFQACASAVLREVLDMFANDDSLGVVFGSGGGTEFRQKRQSALYQRLSELIAKATSDRRKEPIPNLDWIVAIVSSMIGEMWSYAASHPSLQEDEVAKARFLDTVIEFAMAGLERLLGPYMEDRAGTCKSAGWPDDFTSSGPGDTT